jgi:hypothetical protein
MSTRANIPGDICPTRAFGEEIEDREGVYPAITVSGSKIDREFSFNEIGQ